MYFCRSRVSIKLRNCWTFSKKEMINILKDFVKHLKLQTRTVLYRTVFSHTVYVIHTCTFWFYLN